MAELALPELGSGRLGSPGPPRMRVQLKYSVGELNLNVDFALDAPRTVLFGPSGAGKSTLLRLIAGLLAPAEGVIASNGRRVTDTHAGLAVAAGRRGIGYMTQDPALFPHLTVAANVAYGLWGIKREERRTRIEEMLSSFSLEALATRYPARLSGGERQRVGLARVLAPAPTFLLLDESFAGLDARRREEMAAALDGHLHRRGTTLLSVSHDVAEVYASGAEVLLMEAGRITGQGPAAGVLAGARERLLDQLDAGGSSMSGRISGVFRGA